MDICFIMASVGGPKALFGLLSTPLSPDVAYIVVQRMPDDALLANLVDCLKEEVCPEVRLVKGEQTLRQGHVHFLVTSMDFRIDGRHLKSIPATSGRTSLDALLSSALDSGHRCCPVVLSGLLGDDDGMKALQRMSEAGCRILGPQGKKSVGGDLLEQLQKKDLEILLFPQRQLLEQIWFPSGNDFKAPRILIADDDKDVRESLSLLLGNEQFQVDVAVDGLEALRKLKKGRYDALILDLCMPEVNGLQALMALREINPAIPVILMTGNASMAKDAQSLNSPNVMGILHKPFTNQAVRALLTKLAIKKEREAV